MHHTYIGLLHDGNIYFNCFFIQKRVHKTYSKIRFSEPNIVYAQKHIFFLFFFPIKFFNSNVNMILV